MSSRLRSCRLCQQLQLAWKPSWLNRCPRSKKNWKTYDRLLAFSMAQAEAMECRLDLGRSAERGRIVSLAGTFEKKGEFKLEVSTCKRSFSQPLLWRNLVANCSSFVWLDSRTPSMTLPAAVHQIWLVDLEKCKRRQSWCSRSAWQPTP